MYNIKGPSKIVTKTTTRRGITQNIDNYRDINKNKYPDNEENELSNVSKPIFHRKCTSNGERHKSISPHHEEIVNFICDSWNSVCSELDQENNQSDVQPTSQQSHQTVSYFEDEPCTFLQDFKPFDLESWWGKRLYAYYITSTANTNV